MLRKTTQKILSKIKGFEEGKSVNLPPFIILTGPRSCGKSVILDNIVHYCRKNNWIVLFSPSLYDICYNGGFLTPSRRLDDTFDLNEFSTYTLDKVLFLIYIVFTNQWKSIKKYSC